MMSEQKPDDAWTSSERANVRTLFRMALMIFIALVIAGLIAAVLSSAMGTL
jgi:hypothetical protein